MHLRHLRMFEAMARTKNMSRAALEMGVTQARASQVLQQIEGELGYRLFLRSSSGLTLTPAGEALLPFSLQISRADKDAQMAMKAAAHEAVHRVSIGVSHTISAFMVPSLLVRFHEEYPSTHVTITKTMPPELLAGLKSGTFDVCLCFCPPHFAPFIWETLVRTDMFGISSAQMELPQRSSLAAFAQHDMVLPTRQCSSRAALDDTFKKLGITPKVTMEINDASALVSVVKRGIAVSIVPRTMAPVSKRLDVTQFDIRESMWKEVFCTERF